MTDGADLSALGVSAMFPSNSFNDSKESNDEDDDRTKYEFKIVLLGDAAVGKTSLLKRYMKNEFSEEHQCSVGVEFESKTISLDQNTLAVVKIWDTCGEEKFRAMTKQYYRDANGILLLFDLTAPTSFFNLKRWLNEIENTINLSKVSLMVVGAKADLDHKITQDDIDKFIAGYTDLEYGEISAKTGMNIELVFDKILREMVDQAKAEEENEEEETAPPTHSATKETEKPEKKPKPNTVTLKSPEPRAKDKVEDIAEKKGGCC